MKKITTIQLIGYEEKKETGELTNNTLFEIVADSEVEAVEIANKLYPKPNYLLKAYVENYKPDDAPSFTVFFVSCYVRFDAVQGIYYDHTAVQVMAENGEQALERAKTIISKPFYKVTDILQK